MKADKLVLNELYRHRDSQRVGKVIAIEAEQAVLQDDQGNQFSAPLEALAYPVIKSESNHWIDLNANYPKHYTNAFLCRKLVPDNNHTVGNYECIGGADLVRFGPYQGKWQVTVDAPYDEETDSDVRFVGYYASREEAIEALWNERDTIPD